MTRRSGIAIAAALTIVWLLAVPCLAMFELSQRPPPRVSYFIEIRKTPTTLQTTDSQGRVHDLSAVSASVRLPVFFATLLIPIVAVWTFAYTQLRRLPPA